MKHAGREWGGWFVGACLGLVACGSPNGDGQPTPAGSASGLSSSMASASGSVSSPSAAPTAASTFDVREGQALMRSPTEAALYLADEDHSMLRRIALVKELTDPAPLKLPLGNHDVPPLSEIAAKETDVTLPGRPAQVFALGDRVLVTVRDPGLLMVFSAGESPKEIGRVPLPADAWGIAVTRDGSAAFVTSAWTHQVSRVDLKAMKVSWSVDVPREPRGLSVTADGKKLYVSHLVGPDLTRIDTSGDTPKVERLELPADPTRTIIDTTTSASLAYALTMTPDGLRLFVARQALGAVWNWQGNPTVDGLAVADDSPLAPVRGRKPVGTLSKDDLDLPGDWDSHGAFSGSSKPGWVQPRAMVYRKKTHHLLVASEGASQLVELDAMSISPGVLENRLYRLGGPVPEAPNAMQIPPHCGAPTAVALSADEDVAWVYCRTTDEITAVRLHPTGERAYRSETEYIEFAAYQTKLSPWGPFAHAKLAVPPITEDLALGRRLFFDALEPTVSGRMGCAGCHPEGRDDGHVWRERIVGQTFEHFAHFVAGYGNTVQLLKGEPELPHGQARQTPMLAGRVASNGPYGWHGESATLVDRIKGGFELHRGGDMMTDGQMLRMRAEPIAKFLREGLVPPPKHTEPLTPEEAKGKAIFEADKTQCVTCHVPSTELTNRTSVPLATKAPRTFDEDPNKAYKVPSLFYVGGTPPYYHDASAPTLEFLIETNGDHMGRTSHLDAAERAALVAYLKTL